MLIIRPALLGDAPRIVQFNQALAQETEGRSLDPALLEPGVQAVLQDSQKGRYFVAESDGQVVGQLMITFEWSDWRNGVIWWIQSVYVDAAYRRQGVFRRLYRNLEAEARATEGVCGIRLYMEHANHTARATYLSLGMHPAGYEVLELDFRPPSPSVP